MQTADSADLDRDWEGPENCRGTTRHALPALRRYLCGGFCLAGMIVFQNCAKVGAPEPPLVRVPSPATDLAAQEHPDGIILTVSMPTLNTDGSPVSTLKEIEVYRVGESGRGPWEPLPQDEFLWRAERIISVSDDFSHFLHGGTLSFTDPIPATDRAAAYRNSFRYAVRFINNKNQTAGLGNQVTIAPVPLPLPPADLSAEVSQDAVRIRWSPPAENDDGSRPATIAGYEIYRPEDPKSRPSAPLNSGLLLKPEFEDRTFQFDKTYYYVVSAVASTENPYAEGGTSAPLAVTPVDKFPPGAPSDLHAVMDRGVVVLLWAAPEAPDIAGYRVYRAEGANGVPKMLGQGLVTGLSLRDDAVRPGVRYRYSVSAVDTYGNEGTTAETSIEVP